MARRRRPKKRPSNALRGSKRNLRVALFPIVAIAVLLLAGVLGYRFWKERIAEKVEPPRVETAPERKMAVVLYFGDEQQEFLVEENRELMGVSKENLATLLIEELIKGPKGSLQPTIPKGAKLNRKVACEGGICQVDFSREIISEHPGGTSSELMTIYSVVETLRHNIPGVEGVRFLVDGQRIETLAGHIFTGEKVLSNPMLIRGGGGRNH